MPKIVSAVDVILASGKVVAPVDVLVLMDLLPAVRLSTYVVIDIQLAECSGHMVDTLTASGGVTDYHRGGVAG